MDIPGKMAELAEIDLGLPYSIICDTWDVLGDLPATRTDFAKAFKVAVEEYEAIPLFEYLFKDNLENPDNWPVGILGV